MRPAELVFAAVCALWWAASLWVQVAPKQPLLVRLRAWDPVYLLHSYRFYAPRPQALDYFVEYRFLLGAETGAGTETAWQPLAVYAPRGWRSMVWHPELLRLLALYRLVERLAKATEQRGTEAAGTSSAMRQLVRHITALRQPSEASALQVKVATGFHFDPEQPQTTVFHSAWLELPGR